MQHVWNRKPSSWINSHYKKIADDVLIKCVNCGEYRWQPSREFGTPDKLLDGEPCGLERTEEAQNENHIPSFETTDSLGTDY